jgi:raffinose/stachyose/melibiose transport system permease protein
MDDAVTVRATAPQRSSYRIRAVAWRLVHYAILTAVGLTVVIPIAYAVLGGLKDTGQLLNRPWALPDSWFPAKYVEIVGGDTFWRELGNSVLIAAIATVTVVALSSLAAFVFARIAFRGRELLFTIFVVGLLFPVAVAILPLYILLRGLGLLDNPLGVALPQAAFNIPLTIVILRPFFRSIPRELEDAARIDGCGTFGFFWRVLLPLSRPALATVSVLAIVASWNEFLLPLLVLGGPEQWTLPLGVMNFSTEYASDIARVLAFTTLSMVPALLFYVIAERQLVGGLTTGAVKG